MPPATHSLPHELGATFMRIAAYMGGLALVAMAALYVFRASAMVSALQSPPPRPQWIKVEHPHPAFELVMPELAGSPFDYAILRRSADDARKDVLSRGDAAGGGPYVMVEVFRAGSASEHFIDAPSEIAARILDFTVTDDVKPAGLIDSKFGAMALVDFAIKAREKERRCLGFARPFSAPAMQLAGWYCSAHTELVDRALLGCLLDRLTILSAGGDSELAALFARAEVKRSFCGRRNPILAATPEREQPAPDSLQAKAHRAKLRGRLQTR